MGMESIYGLYICMYIVHFLQIVGKNILDNFETEF